MPKKAEIFINTGFTCSKEPSFYYIQQIVTRTERKILKHSMILTMLNRITTIQKLAVCDKGIRITVRDSVSHWKTVTIYS